VTISTFEGRVENGQIRIDGDIKIPENTKVYVIIPDFQTVKHAHISSPHLADPKKAVDFTKKIVEESLDNTL